MDYFLTPTQYDEIKDLLYDTGLIEVSSTLRYRVKNGYCTVYIDNVNPTTSWSVLGTLPAGARPKRTVRTVGYHGPNGRDSMSIIIGPAGNVQMSCETAYSSADGACTVVYPI